MTPVSHEILQFSQDGQLGPLWVTKCYHFLKKVTWDPLARRSWAQGPSMSNYSVMSLLSKLVRHKVLTKKIAAGWHILLAQPHWQNNTESKPLFILLIAKHQGYSPVEPTKYYISKDTMWVHVDRYIKTSQELQKLPFTSYRKVKFKCQICLSCLNCLSCLCCLSHYKSWLSCLSWWLW